MLESKRFASTEDWLEYRVERVHYQEKNRAAGIAVKKKSRKNLTASCGGLTFQQGLWQAGCCLSVPAFSLFI